MSLIEELGELSLICAGQKAQIEELRELLKDADEIIGTVDVRRAPILSIIEAWQTRAQDLLGESKHKENQDG